ncbi:MAG: hypothetical protein ACLFTQ_01605 [Candidatus Aenigmatarchaeota archaeon]
MKKVLLIFSVLFVFAALIPSSLAMEVNYEGKGSCKFTPYTYEINVTNGQESRDIIRIGAPRNLSNWVSIQNRIMVLEPGESETTDVKVDPPQDVKMGEYTAGISFTSEEYPELSRTEEICFIVLREYRMVAEELQVKKEKYKPGDTVEYSIAVENDGTKDFEDGELKVEVMKGNNDVKSVVTDFDLVADRKKTVKDSFSLDKYESPGEYELAYEVIGAGRVWTDGKESFEVDPVAETERSKTVNRGYLGSTKTIEVKNKGNSAQKEKIIEEIGLPAALLVTAEEAEVERSGLSRIYTWELELKPDETGQVSYKIHYWPVYLLLILVGIIAFRSYLYLKAPVVEKNVTKSEISGDKRILTVSLEIKNRLFGRAKNVVLEDSAPSVTRVIEDFDTVEPNVERGEEDTVLRWKIGKINPGESRIIHYKVKVLLESVDYLKFSKAKIRGGVDGRTFERSSSSVKIEV